MKRREVICWFVVAVVGLAAVGAAGVGAEGPVWEWVPVGELGLGSGGDVPRLALDGLDRPYLAYGDWGNEGRAVVLRFDSGAWTPVGEPGFTEAVWEFSMAVTSQGTPYLAYNGDLPTPPMYEMLGFVGGVWQPVGGVLAEAGAGDFSLAVDGQDTPYVAYGDYYSESMPDNGFLTVKRLAGGAWEAVGDARFTSGQAWDPSLALDANGMPYVAFTDMSTDVYARLTVMRFDGIAWELVGGAGFSDGDAFLPSLALDGQGVPYVAYRDEACETTAVTVMRFDGTAWSPVGAPCFSGGPANNPSLAIDAAGTPYLAYTMAVGTGDAQVIVTRFNGSAWEMVGDAPFSHSEFPSLALDGAGNPFVSYLYMVPETLEYGMAVMHWQEVPLFGFTGFFPPVDNPPTQNIAKAGRSIPVKFSLGGDYGLDILAEGYPVWEYTPCEGGSTDLIETYTSGSGLTYDPQTQQYNYVWKTDRSWVGQCGTFVMVLTDGSTHTAEFKFK